MLTQQTMERRKVGESSGSMSLEAIQNPYLDGLVVKIQAQRYLPRWKSLTFRQEHYEQLWSDFIGELRQAVLKRISPTSNTAIFK